MNEKTSNGKIENLEKWIVFPIGAKGGAGKTLILAHLIALLIRLGLSLRVFDFEPVAGTGLSRMIKDATKCSLGKIRDLDGLVNGIVGNARAPRVTLVDLPSNSGDAFLKWAKVLDFSILERHSLRVVLLLVISDDEDSFACAQRWISAFGHGARFVLVYNLGRGEEFTAFTRSPKAIDFLADYRPLEIKFPAIPEYLITPLRNEGLTLFDAIEDNSENIKAKGLEKELMNYFRIKQFQGEIEEAMKPVVELFKQ